MTDQRNVVVVFGGGEVELDRAELAGLAASMARVAASSALITEATNARLAASMVPLVEAARRSLVASPALTQVNARLVESAALITEAMATSTLNPAFKHQLAETFATLAPIVEAAQGPHVVQARTTQTPTPQQVVSFWFVAIWLWWLAQRLSDLDREGVAIGDFDATQLLDFVLSTLELPSLVCGMPSLLGWWLMRRSSR